MTNRLKVIGLGLGVMVLAFTLARCAIRRTLYVPTALPEVKPDVKAVAEIGRISTGKSCGWYILGLGPFPTPTVGDAMKDAMDEFPDSSLLLNPLVEDEYKFFILLTRHCYLATGVPVRLSPK